MEIDYLDKCLSLSNPFGRFNVRLIDFIYKFINKEKITDIIFYLMNIHPAISSYLNISGINYKSFVIKDI